MQVAIWYDPGLDAIPKFNNYGKLELSWIWVWLGREYLQVELENPWDVIIPEK